MNQKHYFLAALIAIVLPITVLLLNFQPTTSQPQVLGAIDAESTGIVPSTYKSIGNPEDMVILPNGQMWYVDSQNSRLVKINSERQIIRTVGEAGSNPGQFAAQPLSITADPQGNVYVTQIAWNYVEETITKFDSNGGFIAKWGGAAGAADGQFSHPYCVHYDAHSDSILVADSLNARVQKLSKNGEFISKFGSAGTAEGQFTALFCVTTDSNGNIYTTDGGASPRIQVFSPDYEFIRSFTAPGIVAIKDIEVLANGNVVITSQNSNRTDIFSPTGTLIREVGGFQHPSFVTSDTSSNFYVSDYTLDSIQKFTPAGDLIPSETFSNSGLTDGKITNPNDVAFDSLGNLYILHFGSGLPQIEKYRADGVWLGTIVSGDTIWWVPSYNIEIYNDVIYAATDCEITKISLTGTVIGHIGAGCGSGDGQVHETRGLAMAPDGSIFVADLFNRRIQKFDSNGNYVRQWGGEGSGPGQFVYPGYIALYNNILYVGDGYNHRIQKFDLDGTYLGEFAVPDAGYIALDSQQHLYVVVSASQINIYDLNGTVLSSFGTPGSGLGQFNEPTGMTFDPVTDNLVIADNNNHRVLLYGPGTRIENLNPSADVVRSIDAYSLANRFVDPEASGINNISSNMTFGDYRVSNFTVDLSNSRDWTNVDAVTLPAESKTVLTNLNPVSAPGVSATHTLYIVKQYGQTSVHICPDATVITDVTTGCANGYDIQYDPNSPPANLSIETINGVEYWKVTGLTGTGAYSLPVGQTPPVTPTPTVTVTQTPTTTPTVTTTQTTTPTVTSSTTPTVTPTGSVVVPTVSTSHTASPTPTNQVGVVTLPPSPDTASSCPSFLKFTASSLMVKPGNTVIFDWTTSNAIVVRLAATNMPYAPNGTFSTPVKETTTFTFVADSGSCRVNKTVTVSVVDTYPWETSLMIGSSALVIEASAALAQPAAIGNLWLGIGALLDKKKKRSWGYAYDSKTKKPLSRVVIRLLDAKTKQVVQTTVTEATGVFKLQTRKGKFLFQIVHPHYTFPSTTVTADTDGGFMGIYHGEEFEVTDPSKPILMSIPLDPINLNEAQKNRIKLVSMLEKFISAFSIILLFAGFSYSLYVTILYPIALNYTVLALYIIGIVMKMLVSTTEVKTTGMVKTTAGKPVAGVEIGLFDQDFKTLLYRTFTANDGTFSFAVPNIDYKLKIMDDKYSIYKEGTRASELSLKAEKSNEAIRLITNTIVVLIKRNTTAKT